MADGWTTTTREAFWRLFPKSGMPMFVLDDDATYTAANEAASDVLGRPVDEIVGRRMGFTTASEHRPELYRTWAELQRTGFVIVPWQIMLPDGSTLDVETTCTRDTP